jgi:alkylhydroperoxidase domain protein
MSPTADVIEAIAGLSVDSPLALLRRGRPVATAHAQGSYTALFETDAPRAFDRADRLTIAVRVGQLHRDANASAWYQQRLDEGGGGKASERLDAALGHVELLTTRPAAATSDDLRSLVKAGLSVSDIVTVSQLASFLSFQIRVAAGLRLLAGGDSGTADAEQPVIQEAPARHAFTLDTIGWAPWLEPLSLDAANDEQRAALAGHRGDSPYFRLLAYDAPILRERSATDDGIFHSPDGLPRAERELAAVISSKVNGCVFCASVHARFAVHYSGREKAIRDILDNGIRTELDERWRRIVDFAAALAATPSTVNGVHLAGLRSVGLDDLEILDLTGATAFFAWANRLMLTIGEPTIDQDNKSRAA